MRLTAKKDIHASHAGVKDWPGMNDEVKHGTSTCESRRQHEISHVKETLVSHDIPDRPWQKVAADLFTVKGKYIS